MKFKDLHNIPFHISIYYNYVSNNNIKITDMFLKVKFNKNLKHVVQFIDACLANLGESVMF